MKIKKVIKNDNNCSRVDQQHEHWRPQLLENIFAVVIKN